MATQLIIDILTSASNSVVLGSLNRSEKWRIDFDPVERAFYGYGYGNYSVSLDDASDNDYFDYFNVIGVLGNEEGFGIIEAENDGDLPDYLESLNYSYGFGYEYGSGFLNDGIESAVVKVTVYENDVPQPDIRVVFKGSPGIIITPQTDVTDSSGEIYIEVSLDPYSSPYGFQNTIRTPGSPVTSTIPWNGVITIFAEADRGPAENEGFAIIRTQAVQLTTTSVEVFDISTYSFSSRYGSTYGFEDYGYWPF